MFEARRRDWINALLAFSQGMPGVKERDTAHVCICVCVCYVYLCMWVYVYKSCLFVCVHMYVCTCMCALSCSKRAWWSWEETKIFQIWFPEREKGLKINRVLVERWGLLVSLLPAGRGIVELPQASNKAEPKTFLVRDRDHNSLTSFSQSEVCVFIFP